MKRSLAQLSFCNDLYWNFGLQVADKASMEDSEKDANDHYDCGRKVGRPPKIRDDLEPYAEEKSPTTTNVKWKFCKLILKTTRLDVLVPF